LAIATQTAVFCEKLLLPQFNCHNLHPASRYLSTERTLVHLRLMVLIMNSVSVFMARGVS